MKNSAYKICSLFLVLFLIVPSVLVPCTAYLADGIEISDTNSYTKSADTRNTIEQYSELKEYLHSNIINCKTEIDISQFAIPYTVENWNAITTMIWDEMFDAFHVTMSLCHSRTTGSAPVFLSITVTYVEGCTKSVYAQQLKECESVANEILFGVAGNNTLTDEEKALIIHDRLAIHCQYADATQMNLSSAHTIYGALALGYAVCEGYAKTYSYLLEKVGIKSFVTDSDYLNHAWNVVYINEKPYHVDVTWDDPVPDLIGKVSHDNFLVSDEGIYNTGHCATDYYTGAIYTDFDNAVWKNSDSEFQLIDNNIYYIDHKTEQLKCYSDNTVLTNVSDFWFTDAYSYWVGNFSKLSSDNENLFFSLSQAVYKYNFATQTVEKIFEPDLSAYDCYNIFGFKIDKGVIQCKTAYSPCDQPDDSIFFSYTYAPETPPMLIQVNGIWYYYANGGLDSSETLVEYGGNWYYINKGIIDWEYSGLIYYNGTWYYVGNGVLNWNYTGLTEYCDNWYYVENGVVNWNYTGLTHFCGCWYYVENGVINWNYTGLVEYYGAYYHIQNGYLDWNYSGLSYYYGDYYYVTNGCLDWNYTGLTEYYGGWYYVSNGYLDWSVTTLTNYYGVWYYVENGAINWNSDTLCYYGDTWYYVKGGVVAWDYIGYVNYYGVNYLITYGYINWYLQ